MPSSGQMANPTSVLDDLDSYLARLSEEEEDDDYDNDVEEREEERQTVKEEVDLGNACSECRATASPLMGATTSGHYGCLKEMLRMEIAADISAIRSENGPTLAHIAARKGDLETLRTLVEAEPTLCKIGDVRGATPTMFAPTTATWTAYPASFPAEHRPTSRTPMARHQYTLHPLRATWVASRSSLIAAKATRMNRRTVGKHQVAITL